LTITAFTGRIQPAITAGENEMPAMIEIGRDEVEKRLGEFIVALANAEGGVLQVPMDVSEAEKLTKETVKMIEPDIMPVVMPVKIGCTIAVPDGVDKPYFFDGRPLIYRDGKVERLSRKEVERIILEKWLVPSFDMRIVKGASIEALDQKLIEEFAALNDVKWPLEFLEQVGLLRGGKVTVAAMLLMGSSPESYLPQSEVYVKRFKSFVSNEFLTQSVFIGPIMVKLRQIVAYVLSELSKDIEKQKVECFRDAVEELIVNAFAHRDYGIPAPLDVGISSEGVRVFVPGAPKADLKPGVPGYIPSIPRNPLLRRALYLAKLAKPHPGWALINAKAKECGIGNIEVSRVHGGLFINIQLGRRPVDISKLNLRQQKLYEYLKTHPVVTRREYEKMMGISERTARLDLENMVKMGVLRREGRGKQIRYRLNE